MIHRDDDDKSVSIAGGFVGGDGNSSYVTFTTKRNKTRSEEKKNKTQYEIIENVTV